MRLRAAALLAMGALVAGCASAPRHEAPAALWQDAYFQYDPARVRVAREEIFRLPEEWSTLAGDGRGKNAVGRERVRAMMDLLYGADRRRFAYAAGATTTAIETWERRRGDCLSLTILTYAAARALDLPARIQEVRVPSIFERRPAFDRVNRHVNLLVEMRARGLSEDPLRPQTMVIDFEPEFATTRRGRSLTEDGVVARFYNNVAVEHLDRGEAPAAYAHFRAAIAADSNFAAAWSNLALLYRRHGMATQAETLLRRAVALAEEPDVALAGLHDLLMEHGRTAQARRVAEQLRAYRDADPYHWIGEALDLLARGENRKAVAALERAQDLSSGFDEVHRYLALAYWRMGDRARANEQLALFAHIDGGSPQVAKLRRKFAKPAAQ